MCEPGENVSFLSTLDLSAAAQNTLIYRTTEGGEEGGNLPSNINYNLPVSVAGGEGRS